ncbi:MAG: hypothetical protein AVDCRST_MAG01-01-4612, partial [uncultured Rubrobacteraceae bacterium]
WILLMLQLISVSTSRRTAAAAPRTCGLRAGPRWLDVFVLQGGD